MCHLKKIETRNRLTHVRGLLGIHAARLRNGETDMNFFDLTIHLEIQNEFSLNHYTDPSHLPYGGIIGVVNLYDCKPTSEIKDISETERLLGNYTAGRFGWMMKDIKPFIDLVPFKAKQGFFFAEIPECLVKHGMI